MKTGEPASSARAPVGQSPKHEEEIEREGARRQHTGNLGEDSLERLLEVRLLLDHADALSSATLGRLDHDRVANLCRALEALVGVVDARLLVNLVRDGDEAVVGRRHLVDARTGPVHARDLRVLRDDGRRDLVAERAHGRAGRADEDNLVLRGGERFGQARVLRGVTPVRKTRNMISDQGRADEERDESRDAPAGPDGVNARALRNIDNDVDVGIIVVVGATGHLDVLVGHANVVGVDAQVFRGRHDDKLDGALRAKRLVRPLAHRADLLDGGDTCGCTSRDVSVERYMSTGGLPRERRTR